MNESKSQSDKFDTAKVIAITGGIGSGKSEVAKILIAKGYKVISTDILAKDIMITDEKVRERIINTFGSDTYTSDNKTNVKFLSEIVFSGDKHQSANIEKLNSIVHPPVIDRIVQEIENAVSAGFDTVFVESALIYEAGLDDGFDYIICVAADEIIRIERTIERSGLTRHQIESRMSEQISQEQKIGLADFTIENNKSLAELENAVNFLLPIIQMLPQNLKEK
ncbi:MAG: dephospho-CoA kinase [Candidatus Kapabacteria bacterium]|nr:dephospho-CoA kinase [Ignavibacteriota bacterium]MCW5884338.1 dephospho-CoA kinase [Candidatus Kapabacteria bacterium]